jgi:hypothetical protein
MHGATIKITFDIRIAKRCFYIGCLTTTCCGLHIGHHQIIRQTVQYTVFFFCQRDLVHVNEISFMSIKFSFKLITVL